MKEREVIDLIVLLSGINTVKSINIKEEKVIMNFPIPLRPSVIKLITEVLDPFAERATSNKEEKKDSLAKGVSTFLSDMIDEGILSSARRVSQQNSHGKDFEKGKEVIENETRT